MRISESHIFSTINTSASFRMRRREAISREMSPGQFAPGDSLTLTRILAKQFRIACIAAAERNETIFSYIALNQDLGWPFRCETMKCPSRSPAS
jgi:hypothetical protein